MNERISWKKKKGQEYQHLVSYFFLSFYVFEGPLIYKEKQMVLLFVGPNQTGDEKVESGANDEKDCYYFGFEKGFREKKKPKEKLFNGIWKVLD